MIVLETLEADASIDVVTDYVPKAVLFLVFALLVAWETARPFVKFSYQEAGARLWHGAKNVAVGFAGAAISYVLFLPAWHAAAEWSAQHGWGLLHRIPMPSIALAISALLLLDLWTYWWHRMNHRIPFFWRFHRMHHSDPWMDLTTAQRFHPGEIVFSSALRIPVIVLLGLDLWHIVLYEVTMLSVVLFHHANIAVAPELDRALRTVVPSPVMHKIHHSRLQPETDSNYGALLSIWDRLFASFRLRTDWNEVSFGLDGYDDAADQSLAGLMKTPLRS